MDEYKVCTHLENGEAESHIRYFTGNWKEYYLICSECSKNVEDLEKNLIEIDEASFKKIDFDIWSCDGIKGQPNILSRETKLYFRHEIYKNENLIKGKVIDFSTVESESKNIIILVNSLGEIVEYNFDDNSCKKLFTISDEMNINLKEEVSIKVSSDGKIASIVNTKGQYGIVINLKENKILMKLDRGNYHNEHSIFPIAFFNYNSQQLLVHGTDWNRLDISNPLTNELLTSRNIEENKLDYFHSEISISADNKWIVDNGWVWHPIGVVKVWNLNKWINENVFESESGATNKTICQRIYFWNKSICWINNQTIGVYGFGEDEDWIIPAIRIFDIKSQEEIFWFPGPENNLMFDKYLFSSSETSGTDVWDLNTGEKLLNDKFLKTNKYNRSAKKFISILENNNFQVSSLIE